VKIIPMTFRDIIHKAYAERVGAAKRTSWRKPVTTTQEPSTQAILTRDPSKDAEHFNRTDPANWKAVPNAKTTEEAIGARAITSYEKYVYKWLQHKTTERNTVGESLSSGVDEERRRRAVSAFMAACGTGRKYSELTPDERKRVKSYFLDLGLGRAATPAEYEALRINNLVEIDKLVAAEVEKVRS
jgi:hypothetical protein